jgi:pimeloyl-ACP methyl ester carboxylesterase
MSERILYSKIEGTGNPLLILHGYFGMSDNWKTLGSKFAQDFEVHLIDQRNHGRSFHADAFNYQVLVDDLRNYIEHHQLEKAAIIGHSMGGKTAMLFAAQYPNLVHRLVLADISPRYYEPHHNAILAALNSVDFSVQNSRSLVDEKVATLIPELGVRQFLLKNVYWKEKGHLGFRFNLSSLTVNNAHIGDALPNGNIFNGKTLFLKGGNSNYITDREVPIIKTHFPNSEIKQIANVGHWLHAEKPQAFLEIVLPFLKD